ncbi:sister chromatid cohesion protein Dcc1 [Haematococcus lacustris]
MHAPPLLLPPGKPRILLNSPNGVRDDLKLLEVDSALLDYILQHGVVIKGAESEEAVLCSCNKTYALKYVETTNTQLLVQPEQEAGQDGQSASQRDCASSQTDMDSQDQFGNQGLQTQMDKLRSRATLPPVVVHASTKAHIEVVECAPRLERLQQLLAERPYGAEDEEAEEEEEEAPGQQAGLYTTQQLQALVQASDEEVLEELRALHAVQLGPHWRLVEPGYLGQLLELLVLSAQALGQALDRLDPDCLTSSMAADGCRPELVRHCLHVFGHPQQAAAGPQATTWALDNKKVCVHWALKVLSRPEPLSLAAGASPSSHASTDGPADPGCSGFTWGLPAFMAAWQAAVPGGMEPRMELLRGEVLVQGSGAGARVQLFSVRALPSEPSARFHALFSMQPRWEGSELEPYLADLKVPGKTAGALLLKYTRASQPTPDGPVYYTAR